MFSVLGRVRQSGFSVSVGHQFLKVDDCHFVMSGGGTFRIALFLASAYIVGRAAVRQSGSRFLENAITINVRKKVISRISQITYGL